MGTVSSFNALLAAHGSNTTYHRSISTTPCPCLTPEGFRDPEWHDSHPAEPVCNERGYLVSATEIACKAFVQPVMAARSTRMTVEYLAQMFGEVQENDHFGIFPESWASTSLDFSDWSQSGDSYIVYNGNRYLCVAANLIPDPDDGNPRHHWEIALRLIDG